MYLQGKNTCYIRVNTVFVTGQGEHIESGTFPERLVLRTDCLERARKHQQRWRRSRRSHMSLLKREMVRNSIDLLANYNVARLACRYGRMCIINR